MKKDRVYAFDFDGTLTTCDTLPLFIRFACGRLRFVCGFALFSPLIVLMKLRLLPNWRVKQWLFSYYFRGIEEGKFDAICQRFAAANRHILRTEGMRLIEKVLANGAQVFIVSASIDNWVRPFFGGLSVTVVGTQIGTADGRLTGHFKTRNCYGEEKVKRLLQVLPSPRKNCEIVAYGDSRGDKELLAFADIAHHKTFHCKDMLF